MQKRGRSYDLGDRYPVTLDAVAQQVRQLQVAWVVGAATSARVDMIDRCPHEMWSAEVEVNWLLAYAAVGAVAAG